jgi:hypothetical protein
MRSKFKDEHPFGERRVHDPLSFLLLAEDPYLIHYSPFLEKRKAEAERIRQKYPDRIPVRYLLYRWAFRLTCVSTLATGDM